MLKSIKKNRKNNLAGFTLVEALVAISILMIAIASPMTLAQKGLSTATLSKDQMIASFLAQDAIESVKNIRDQTAVSQSLPANWLSGGSTGPSLSNCICNSDDSCNFDSPSRSYCIIDTTASRWNSTSITKPSDLNNPSKLKVSYDDLSKKFLKYDYNETSADSIFTRYINIRQSSSNPNEAVVKVRVSWNSPQGIQNMDIEDFIYNYSENL